ncbi:hypothetical protein LEMLEM_LOCUS23513 [Lemmus lemmus]
METSQASQSSSQTSQTTKMNVRPDQLPTDTENSYAAWRGLIQLGLKGHSSTCGAVGRLCSVLHVHSSCELVSQTRGGLWWCYCV